MHQTAIKHCTSHIALCMQAILSNKLIVTNHILNSYKHLDATEWEYNITYQESMSLSTIYWDESKAFILNINANKEDQICHERERGLAPDIRHDLALVLLYATAALVQNLIASEHPIPANITED